MPATACCLNGRQNPRVRCVSQSAMFLPKNYKGVQIFMRTQAHASNNRIRLPLLSTMFLPAGDPQRFMARAPGDNRSSWRALQPMTIVVNLNAGVVKAHYFRRVPHAAALDIQEFTARVGSGARLPAARHEGSVVGGNGGGRRLPGWAVGRRRRCCTVGAAEGGARKLYHILPILLAYEVPVAHVPRLDCKIVWSEVQYLCSY
jgi:hypothetical protein